MCAMRRVFIKMTASRADHAYHTDRRARARETESVKVRASCKRKSAPKGFRNFHQQKSRTATATLSHRREPSRVDLQHEPLDGLTVPATFQSDVPHVSAF